MVMVKPTLQDFKDAGGHYSIIYDDYPWQYDQGGRGAANNQYGCEPLERLRRFSRQVGEIAAPDAVKFSWVTMPFLKDGISVHEEAGFRFKTCAFTWVKYHEPSGKPVMGNGMWTRANAELCLLFVRGEPPRRVSAAVRQLVEEGPTELDEVCIRCAHLMRLHSIDGGGPCHGSSDCYCERLNDGEQVLRAPRLKVAGKLKHSAKPPEVRRRIDELMGPDLPRVELFARERAPGWDCWGADAPGGGDFEMEF